MEVCNLPRGRGKTTYLVYRSHITHTPILCMNQIHAKTIKDTANRLDISIPDPITASEYVRDYINTKSKKKPDKVLEFAQYLREKGLWRDDMKIYKDKNGNLIAE